MSASRIAGIRGGTLHAAVDFVPVGGLAIAVRFGPQPDVAALVVGDDRQVGAVIHPFDPRGVGAEADPSMISTVRIPSPDSFRNRECGIPGRRPAEAAVDCALASGARMAAATPKLVLKGHDGDAARTNFRPELQRIMTIPPAGWRGVEASPGLLIADNGPATHPRAVGAQTVYTN
ncbi:MAG: hypothetical protein IPO18_09415 [bacterium]|nr:hypothetical protein [bacterium]